MRMSSLNEYISISSGSGGNQQLQQLQILNASIFNYSTVVVAGLENGVTGELQDTQLGLKVLIAIGCLLVILLSVFGNLLVVSVIIRYKRLQNATNYILLSLAIADLTVSFLVMVPAMITDVKDKWIFNETFCKIYNAFDITCCTASILHLLLVAIDRYIAIFKPLKYKNLVRKWHVFLMVLFVWTLSLCMSFVPIFLGWNLQPASSNQANAEIESFSKPKDENCLIDANMYYGIISSSLSFYIPLVIMTIVYIRIFIVARRQANAIAEIEMRTRGYYLAGIQQQQLYESQLREQQQQTALLSDEPATRENVSSVDLTAKESFSHGNANELNSTITGSLNDNNNANNTVSGVEKKKTNRFIQMIRSLKSIEKRKTKDTKAIKTLGIIMGIFIACWLPFFIMYLVHACTQKVIFPKLIDRLITWVGYTNSFINPIVYALTNRDFRKAYTSTLRSVALFLCPMALYQKLILRNQKTTNQKNHMGGPKHVSSATGISELNANLYSQPNGLGRNNENGAWTTLGNVTSSICDSSKGLLCNRELFNKLFCCCACCSNANAATSNTKSRRNQNGGNHGNQTENGGLASSQTSSAQNEKPKPSYSAKPLTSIRKLLALSQSKRPTATSAVTKESTISDETNEETVKFLSDLDDRFKRFDKQGNLISCRL